MGTYQKAIWMSEGLGRTRRERQSGAYHYYLPTKLSDLKVALDPDVVGDIGRAEQAVANLSSQVKSLGNTKGLARLLLRAEAVSSSYIEGLEVGTRRLLRAEMHAGGKADFPYDETAVEIMGNVHAMEDALEEAESEKCVTRETFLKIHRTLCKGTRIEKLGGIVRDRQNWVGGNSYNPLDAEYIPPAPEHIDALLDDLAVYCNDTVVSPVLQAAIAHAQFESIHPFIDGNGRTGRALIHLILRRRGLAPNLVPPVSLVMATRSKDYVRGLTAFRSDDSDEFEKTQEGLNEWVSFFAGSCAEACEEALDFERSTAELQGKWRVTLGKVRANSALDLLLGEMTGMPVFTIDTASKAIGRSFSSTSDAIERCVEKGIVKQIGNNRRYRSFEAPEVIDEFNIFERRLASPAGDTRAAKPARPVPDNLKKNRGKR
ncbi:MAG: Fic family protein [Coriobacteriales bacterium]|jgi:Fic family protein